MFNGNCPEDKSLCSNKSSLFELVNPRPTTPSMAGSESGFSVVAEINLKMGSDKLFVVSLIETVSETNVPEIVFPSPKTNESVDK